MQQFVGQDILQESHSSGLCLQMPVGCTAGSTTLPCHTALADSCFTRCRLRRANMGLMHEVQSLIMPALTANFSSSGCQRIFEMSRMSGIHIEESTLGLVEEV